MLASLNQSTLLFLHTFAISNAFFADVVIFFAEWFPFLVIGSVVLYELYAQDKEHKIIGAVIRTLLPAVFAWLFVVLIKYVHPMPRPFAFDPSIIPLINVPDPFGSFPSGHASAFGALAGAMLGNRFHGWKWYLLAAVIISTARIAVGVHWPVDVIFGLTLGFLGGFLIARPLAMIKW